jgi:hypothetical protein
MSCSSRTRCLSRWGVVLEDLRSLLGLGCCIPSVLEFARDKKERLDILLKGQAILSI